MSSEAIVTLPCIDILGWRGEVRVIDQTKVAF